MSSEFNPGSMIPSNAGVLLINIPFMRKTYKQFMHFIRQGIKSGGVFNHPSPSDQGAYLSFYNETARFLVQRFNSKPYWDAQGPHFDNPFILHFHGAKPHDYLNHFFGHICDKAIQILCDKAEKLPHLCEAFQAFAQYVPIDDYCLGSFSDIKEQRICTQILASMMLGSSSDCSGSFSRLLLRNATWDDMMFAQNPASVSKDDVNYITRWQLFLSTVSLLCLLLGGKRLFFRNGYGKKYRAS